MAELKAADKKGIFIYITAGAPDVETTLKAVREALQSLSAEELEALPEAMRELAKKLG